MDRDGSWSPDSSLATCGWRIPTNRPNAALAQPMLGTVPHDAEGDFVGEAGPVVLGTVSRVGHVFLVQLLGRR